MIFKMQTLLESNS